MSVKHIFIALVSCLLLLFLLPVEAFAEIQLPEGAVKGLPERLAALDDEGNAVNSATGEYFFHVENMQYGQTYTKNIQLMNLREDHGYYIYFYVEPLYKSGEIDLEKGCDCKFFLDGDMFYQGDVNGKGNIDLTGKYYSCGYYLPGDSHVLRCDITWNDIDVIRNVDNGHRLVDKDGEHVLEGPDESGYAEGEIEFKWIFFASVHEISSSASDELDTTDVTDIIESFPETEHPTDVKSRTDESNSTDETNHTEPSNSEKVNSNQISSETTPSTPNHSNNNTFSTFFSPFTGYLAKDGTIWLICIGAVSLGIVILLILMHREKKKRKKHK